MQTIKIKYKCSKENLNLILDYQKQYSNCLHYNYNRLKDNSSLTEKDLRNNSNNINNCNLIKSYLMQCSIKEAKQILNTSNKPIIFGGKKLYFKRLKNLISKEEYKIKKSNPLYIIGEKPKHGNRLVQIDESLDILHLKLSKNYHIDIELINIRNYKPLIEKLFYCQLNCLIPITYKINQEYVYISFDESVMKTEDVLPVKNRTMALDLNPNYIGWSIVDWKSSSEFEIIKTGVYSIKKLNDIDFNLKNKGFASDSKQRTHISNKRKHEVLQISKNLIDIARYYRCEMFIIEDLKIESSNKNNGSKYNRLCNNLWCRNVLVNNLNKRCNLLGIKFLKVIPNYSSFIGNIMFRSFELPDMVLASIEIGRRGYEFYNQYTIKTKEKTKNIIQPIFSDFKDLISKSLEEFKIEERFESLIDLYYFIKNLKLKYRVSLEDLNLKFCRFFSSSSFIQRTYCYNLI